jgi:hypothetical protein
MKTKHLLHPLRTVRIVRDRLTQYVALRKAVHYSKKNYRGDPRYCLEHVAEGFRDRYEPEVDDTALLKRICVAYTKAIEGQPVAEVFRATQWWQSVFAGSLRPVTQALATHDISALQVMYRNFFRDPCGAGLIGLPVNMTRSYFGARIKTDYKHLFLGDALHQFDYWKNRTGGRFSAHDLEAPGIGNPFGFILENSLIRSGAVYQHYYAQKIAGLLQPNQRNVIAEIGGGYGGTAYYLKRDYSNTTYINFDLPETIALASYYLLKAFPEMQVVLYGEGELTEDIIAGSDIILMPNFELLRLPASCVNVFFNSHVLADMSLPAIQLYLEEIARTTRGYIFHLNRGRACGIVADYLRQQQRSRFVMLEEQQAAWHSARSSQNDEIEQLYVPLENSAHATVSKHLDRVG